GRRGGGSRLARSPGFRRRRFVSAGQRLDRAGRAVPQVQATGTGVGEGFELALGRRVAADLEGSADQSEVDTADDVGMFVGGFEQRAPCQPEAVPFGGRPDARGCIIPNGFRGEPELVEQGDCLLGGRDPLGSGRTRSIAVAGTRLGVGRIYLVAGLRLGGRALFGGLPGEVTAPVDSGRDSVFTRV